MRRFIAIAALFSALWLVLRLAFAADEPRPYEGYDDLGDVTPTRGIVLEHPPGGYELFMVRMRSRFDLEESWMVTGTNVLTLSDFSWAKNGPVEVLVYSFSDARSDHSETNLFRVTIKRPATAPKARAVNLGTNTIQNPKPFIRPPLPSFITITNSSLPASSIPAVPSSGPLPVMTPEQWGEGRAKMKYFHLNRPPRRGMSNSVPQ